jgi:hypothetical protein
MFILVRYEAYPELFTHTLSGYRGVISGNLLIEDSWSRVLIHGIPAGYSHTTMNIVKGAQHNIEIGNRIQLKFAVAGQLMRITARTDLVLDPSYHLISFTNSIIGSGINMSVTGRQRAGLTYRIETNINGSKSHQEIRIPKDVMLYSPLSMLALRKLRPGQSLAIKTIDPLSMSTTHVIVKAIEHETIQTCDGDTESTRLEFNYKGMRLKSWIDKDGTILRQETPLGWVIESCPASAAFSAARSKSPPPELMADGNPFIKLISGINYDKN